MKAFKYILTVTIALFTFISAKGQHKYVPNFDFYIGTWIYESENEQFILMTKKYSFTFGPNNDKFYRILGAFKYVKNGTVVYDFLDELDGMTIKNRPRIIFANINDLPNNQEHQELRIQYSDPKTYQQNSSRLSRLSIFSKNPDKLKWHLVVEDWEPDPECPLEFTIPYDMILTKVEEE